MKYFMDGAMVRGFDETQEHLITDSMREVSGVELAAMLNLDASRAVADLAADVPGLLPVRVVVP